MMILKAGAMKNKGIIVINKPKDWTSFDVVNKIKHLTKMKKVGHLGTLDPMATGILLVTVGKATKLFDIMQEKKKTYIATFNLRNTIKQNLSKSYVFCSFIKTNKFFFISF